jgi:hypothetical protein
MAGDNTLLLVIASGISSEFEDLGCEVFEDGSEVDGGTGTDTLSIVSALQHTMDTTDGELEEKHVKNVENIDEKNNQT